MFISVTEDEKKRAKQEAASQAKGMQLNVVRLCYQGYLTDNDGNVTAALESIISDPIYDSSKSFTLHLFSSHFKTRVLKSFTLHLFSSHFKTRVLGHLSNQVFSYSEDFLGLSKCTTIFHLSSVFVKPVKKKKRW
jgi:hypothetical protein